MRNGLYHGLYHGLYPETVIEGITKNTWPVVGVYGLMTVDTGLPQILFHMQKVHTACKEQRQTIPLADRDRRNRREEMTSGRRVRRNGH